MLTGEWLVWLIAAHEISSWDDPSGSVNGLRVVERDGDRAPELGGGPVLEERDGHGVAAALDAPLGMPMSAFRNL